MLAGDSVSPPAALALAHGVSSSICADCYNTGGRTPITLRDAGPVLGRSADTARGHKVTKQKSQDHTPRLGPQG